ncbi:MAG: tRNA (N(6)-L-threonylcarbamoyladenosine(37)-C(2))-methylthiotransferase MtaB [Chloroflexi bacterium 44-23]|nr:MAG: tRNA (N(6)-L-threonylcarbamoyladenosine(37)-C(2))-methylthiotransferase MtaB [Chloroflexi bacterium 44-23]
MNIFLDTIGCRLNQSEIEIMAAQFRQAGHEIVPTSDIADLVVINTCAVTAAAASDSRQKIRQAAKNNTAQVVVTGCWATLEPDLAQMLPGVENVVVNERKPTLVSDLLHISPQIFDVEPLARLPLPGDHMRTRAFIKVQDGCDNFCTFCVTKVARGKSTSEPMEKIMLNIQRAIAGDVKEIVLSGVNLGSWGRDFKHQVHLRDLIAHILDETEVPRLRLSSLEPWDLDDQFFNIWRDSRLCNHLHLPLQSGADAVLRRMARKTSQNEFRRIVDLARAENPEMAITTDMIVGFPGESDVDFRQTMDFVREINFSAGHVFTFSARPGTAAAKYENQVHGSIRKHRSAELRALFAEMGHQYQKKYLGKQVQVLWESGTMQADGSYLMVGLSSNYLRVCAYTVDDRWNQIDTIVIKRFQGELLFGEVL